MGLKNPFRAVAWRDSVVDCGSPLPLFLAGTGRESAWRLGNQNCSLRRVLAGKQSKSWRVVHWPWRTRSVLECGSPLSSFPIKSTA